jgi:hypothetical protein
VKSPAIEPKRASFPTKTIKIEYTGVSWNYNILSAVTEN